MTGMNRLAVAVINSQKEICLAGNQTTEPYPQVKYTLSQTLTLIDVLLQ